MPSAILLIAHGSRVPEANADLLRVADSLRQRCPEELVEIAYLELAQPDIPAGVRRCVERGASDVRMLPYFLSAGSHVTRDLEGYRRQFEEDYPEVRFRISPPLGLHPNLIDVLLDRLEEAM